MPITNSSHAELAAALQDLLERRDQRLAALEAEALGAGIAAVEEPLEGLGRGQALEDRPLALGGEVGLVARPLDPLLDPRLLGRLLDVHVLDADACRNRSRAAPAMISRSVAVSRPKALLMKIGRS